MLQLLQSRHLAFRNNLVSMTWRRHACVNQRLNSSPRAPPLCTCSYVTLIASDVCSIRTKVSCKVDITGYSAMIPVRSECIPFKIKIVYIRSIWCHTRLCLKTLRSANHEWMFQSEVNYNGFPLLRGVGSNGHCVCTVVHVNWNTVPARSALLTSWLSELGMLTKRDMQNMHLF